MRKYELDDDISEHRRIRIIRSEFAPIDTLLDDSEESSSTMVIVSDCEQQQFDQEEIREGAVS